MTDVELTDKMFLAYIKHDDRASWEGIVAALAVARPIIEREVLEKAEQLAFTSKGYPTDVSQKIRALGEVE